LAVCSTRSRAAKIGDNIGVNPSVKGSGEKPPTPLPELGIPRIRVIDRVWIRFA
jgi:hypothetical protein